MSQDRCDIHIVPLTLKPFTKNNFFKRTIRSINIAQSIKLYNGRKKFHNRIKVVKYFQNECAQQDL